MKKLFTALLILCLALSLCSCGTKTETELVFSTGGTGGTYYAYGTVIAQYVSDNTDVSVSVVPSNGSQSTLESLSSGESQLGFVQNDVAYYAYNGTGIFEGQKGITDFAAVASLYTETVQIVTCDFDIKNVSDLAGRIVSVGAEGSGVYYNALDVLAAYDMTIEDIDPRYLDFDASAEALNNGEIDAAFIVAGEPTSAVANLCSSKLCYLVELDTDHISTLMGISPLYTEYYIPAGTYCRIDKDTHTVGVKATIIARTDVPADAIYDLVSAIFEGKEDITSAYAKGSALDLNFASVCGLPYHPGAAKFFSEKGYNVETGG